VDGSAVGYGYGCAGAGFAETEEAGEGGLLTCVSFSYKILVMAEGYGPYRLVLLLIAGIAGTIVSAFGLFAEAWGGWGRSVAEFSFSFLPALSFPTFIVSLRFHRVGLILSCLIPLGTFAAISAVNLRSCWKGECTTTNPISILFGTLVRMPQIWIPLSVMPVCLYFFICLLPSPQNKRFA
jgi:hypothetical protein